MSDRQRVLAALRNGPTHSHDLRKWGITGNPSERVRELRREGYEIDVTSSPRGRRPGVLYELIDAGTGAANDSDSARLITRAGSGTDRPPIGSDPESAPPAAGSGSSPTLFELEPRGPYSEAA